VTPSVAAPGDTKPSDATGNIMYSTRVNVVISQERTARLSRVLQGNVTQYEIPLDDVAGTSNRPQYLTTRFHNGASCVPGRVNTALRLESSRQYVTVDEPQPSCFNNLELCNIGLCISFYLEISGTLPDVQLLKTDAYSVHTHNSSSVQFNV